ncbi:MAG: hypothetical protein NUV64_01095 [Parcubacteria group bacterium]|nr:hypothetical protein [Parcubacteria group bacterium]MCR4342282.1 hypothetical protein [Patescibacteria group bacterium]
MAIEGHFEDFDKKAFEEEQSEDPRIDDAFSVIDEDPSDPHFKEAKPRPDKFTDNELEAVKKFKEGNLSEEELTKDFDKVGDLKEGNPRLEFLAAVRNKILTGKAWERLVQKRRGMKDGE